MVMARLSGVSLALTETADYQLKVVSEKLYHMLLAGIFGLVLVCQGSDVETDECLYRSCEMVHGRCVHLYSDTQHQTCKQLAAAPTLGHISV